jgi:hypothetical protein
LSPTVKRIGYPPEKAFSPSGSTFSGVWADHSHPGTRLGAYPGSSHEFLEHCAGSRL